MKILSAGPTPMVSVTVTLEYRIIVDEPCGIAHERQIITVPLPAGRVEEGQLLLLTDRESGRTYPVQPSRAEPGRGFLLVEIAPFEKLNLEAGISGFLPEDADGVSLTANAHSYILANDRIELDVIATGEAAADDLFPHGPVGAVRVAGQSSPWRGRTFFDTRRPPRCWTTEIVELGPLRTALRYSACFGDSSKPTYWAEVSLDADSSFVRITERWAGNAPGDQLVWDFAADDLPGSMLRLDSTAGCTAQPLNYFQDLRLCRLFAWTQQSQLSDLSDGYALNFTGGDAVGFVTLEGGSWTGNRLNHLEAWTRRWVGADPASRRDVPDGAKRDVVPSPERIPARGVSRTTSHLNVEGWIGEVGSRTYAVYAGQTADLLPEAGLYRDSRHFENVPDRERDRVESSLLRRIHTQHGLLPLSALAETVFRLPHDDREPSSYTYPNAEAERQIAHRDQAAPPDDTPERREERRKCQMMESLAARVYGFWEGGGSGGTNPVSSRDIAPRMLQYEYLVSRGMLTPEERTIAAAHFLFLIKLFGSDNYYPGLATMLPAEHPDSTEPTLEGMANQNFYTDVVNIPGMGAQVFLDHPEAASWRTRFTEHWSRQLAYHVYPESGVWEESHTYFQHVLDTVLPTLLRRRADGVADGFADPALQRLVAGALRQITPRDSRFGNRRYLAPFGDHSAGHANYYAIYRTLAESIAPHDPELAGRLSWAYQEMGGEDASPPVVTPIAPPIVSEAVQGLGCFLRGTDDTGAEFLLALRAGSAWGHHHHDEGSIQFWAKGRSLIVDRGFGEWDAGASKFRDHGHSRWALTDYPAMNYRYRFNRGWITAGAGNEPFEFAVAHAPTYTFDAGSRTDLPLPGGGAEHRRCIVRVGPCAFLMVDVAETPLAQIVRFHLPEGDLKPAEGGVTVAYGDGCRLTLLSVLAGQAPLTVVGTMELKNGRNTVEVAAPVAPEFGRSRIAYLVVANGAGEPVLPTAVAGGAGGAQVCGHGFSVTISFPDEQLMCVADDHSRLSRIVDLSSRGSFA